MTDHELEPPCAVFNPALTAADREARALAGDILGDDGLPEPALAAIVARRLADELARPDLAELADALEAPTARERRRALRRILDEPAFLAALIQTPTGPLVESIPGRVY